jgi:hypothetical protein
VDIVPVLVAFHSAYWVRVAVESYLETFPGERLLVVDNNPRRDEPGWYPHCEEERDWLAAHPGVRLVDNPRPPEAFLPDGRLEHGAGIDVGLEWCRAHGARVLIHLEPDCLVSGRQWRDNLVQALDAGAWMAGGLRQSHGPIHPTPSAWLVERTGASFRSGTWAPEEEESPHFAALVNLPALHNDPSRGAHWIRTMRYWDTGHRPWFRAAAHGRAALVPTPGFRHYWNGSLDRRFSEGTLAERFPELRPYLERGRARRRARPPESCPHRDGVRQAAGGEVACCRLLVRLSGLEGAAAYPVRREACRACGESVAPSADRLNPVVASLLYALAEQAAGHGDGPGRAWAAELLRRAEAEAGLDLP